MYLAQIFKNLFQKLILMTRMLNIIKLYHLNIIILLNYNNTYYYLNYNPKIFKI